MFGMGTGVTPPLKPPGIKPDTVQSRCLPGLVGQQSVVGGSQVTRAISIGRLRTSRPFHPRPINLVISEGSSGFLRNGIPHLGAGFTLRCFQRLSVPNVDTRRCAWRHNRYTRGSSIRVLSYYGQIPTRIQRLPQIETKLSHDVLNPAHVPL